MNKVKTVIITGAGGGLGSAAAIALATAGYELALHIKQEDEKSSALLQKLNSLKARVSFYTADLTSDAEIEKMTAAIEQKHGSIYALINNAGIPFSGMSWKQTAAEWDHVFNVNTRAPFLVSRQVIPLIRKQGSGRIIYLSSIVAHRPLAGTSAYAASKAALEGLTRAQAVELSRFGITVNCVAPGYFDAGMIDSVTEEQQSALKENTPAARLGKPEELAAHMLYLCSEEAAFITGQIHHINGGLYL
jgi:3-oxoacyl-[acyl-carrier protein] reductase